MPDISNTYLIGKHLILQQSDNIQQCALCGADNPVLEKKVVIGASFMDDAFLSGSNYLCIYCAACIGIGQPQNLAIRTTSFLATEKQLIRLKREQLWENILHPPVVPFVFGITYTHKKHISFKSYVNFSRDIYMIRTENESVTIKRDAIRNLCEIIQNWYTICRDISTKPTFFTKQDVLSGCNNYKKIEHYGADRYLSENKKIERYRKTSLLKLLVYALNKGEKREKKDD